VDSDKHFLGYDNGIIDSTLFDGCPITKCEGLFMGTKINSIETGENGKHNSWLGTQVTTIKNINNMFNNTNITDLVSSGIQAFINEMPQLESINYIVANNNITDILSLENLSEVKEVRGLAYNTKVSNIDIECFKNNPLITHIDYAFAKTLIENVPVYTTAQAIPHSYEISQIIIKFKNTDEEWYSNNNYLNYQEKKIINFSGLSSNKLKIVLEDESE
jgi:hypothetical protein